MSLRIPDESVIFVTDVAGTLITFRPVSLPVLISSRESMCGLRQRRSATKQLIPCQTRYASNAGTVAGCGLPAGLPDSE